MPKDSKRKKREESVSGDDSSGPEDRTPAKSKAKVAAAAATNSKESKFDLGNKKSVTVREWKGKVYVDIREFYMDANGQEKPGKKGISMTADQWKKLKSITTEIDAALLKFE